LLGRLAGSVRGVRRSPSGGDELQPHIGGRDDKNQQANLKKQNKNKNKQTNKKQKAS